MTQLGRSRPVNSTCAPEPATKRSMTPHRGGMRRDELVLVDHEPRVVGPAVQLLDEQIGDDLRFVLGRVQRREEFARAALDRRRQRREGLRQAARDDRDIRSAAARAVPEPRPPALAVHSRASVVLP